MEGREAVDILAGCVLLLLGGLVPKRPLPIAAKGDCGCRGKPLEDTRVVKSGLVEKRGEVASSNCCCSCRGLREPSDSEFMLAWRVFPPCPILGDLLDAALLAWFCVPGVADESAAETPLAAFRADVGYVQVERLEAAIRLCWTALSAGHVTRCLQNTCDAIWHAESAHYLARRVSSFKTWCRSRQEQSGKVSIRRVCFLDGMRVCQEQYSISCYCDSLCRSLSGLYWVLDMLGDVQSPLDPGGGGAGRSEAKLA